MSDSRGGDLNQSSDRIIGTAFRYSVLVIVVLVGAGLLIRAWLTDEPEQIVVNETNLEAPVIVTERSPVEPTKPDFVNITEPSGLDFVHENGARGERMLPETMGGNAAFLDHDSDGDQDILLVSSGHWPWDDSQDRSASSLALYDNDGNGQFTRIMQSDLGPDVYAMGVTVADIDGDSDPDLYITAVGENIMMMNEGAGQFKDVSSGSGATGAGGWSTGAAFFDADGDQDLDLFVIDYVVWSRDIDLKANYQLTGIGRAYGPPTNFEGTQPMLFINNGLGQFIDESLDRGVFVLNPATQVAVAKSLAIMPVDLDADGDMDLFVANDTTRNFAYINDGKGNFIEAGELMGLAFDNMGKSTGAMGVDVSWGSEGEPSLAVGNFANEMTSVYTMDPATGNYADDAVLLGVGARSRAALTFGVLYIDYDLDGREDLFQANGHVEDEINRVQPSQTHAQQAQLFWNCGQDCDRVFQPVESDDLADLSEPMIGRGAAYADIDGDGDLDILVGQTGAAAQLFRNDTASGNWVRLQLIRTDANTQALGCHVTHEWAGSTQIRLVQPTRSYLSQIETTLTFGLGEANETGSFTVSCPDGKRHVMSSLAVNQTHTILIE